MAALKDKIDELEDSPTENGLQSVRDGLFGAGRDGAVEVAGAVRTGRTPSDIRSGTEGPAHGARHLGQEPPSTAFRRLVATRRHCAGTRTIVSGQLPSLDHMTRDETVTAIHNAIVSDAPDLKAIVAGRRDDPAWATWYGLALSELALLLGEDDEIVLSNAAVTLTGANVADGYSACIVILTTTLAVVVRAEYDGGHEEHSTRALARADLRSLAVSAGVSALLNVWPNEWPGDVRLVLDYEDGTQLRVPSTERTTARQRDAVLKVLPSLKSDLAAR